MSDPKRIVCGGCLATNRVPVDRLADHPKCGRCGRSLFAGEPVIVDDTGLAKMLAGNDIPVVVDFWAPWCGPCRSFAPVYARAAAELEPAYRFLKLDTDAQPQSGAIHAIRSIPTLGVFVSGREVARHSGTMPMAKLREFLAATRQDRQR